MWRGKILMRFHVKNIICSGCIYVLLNEILPREKERQLRRRSQTWMVRVSVSELLTGSSLSQGKTEVKRWEVNSGVSAYISLSSGFIILSSWNKSIFFTDQIITLTDLNQQFVLYFKIPKPHLLPFWICSPIQQTGSWTITFPWREFVLLQDPMRGALTWLKSLATRDNI